MANTSNTNRYKNLFYLLYIIMLICAFIISLFPEITIKQIINFFATNKFYAERWRTLDLGSVASVTFKQYVLFVWGFLLLWSLPFLIITIPSFYNKHIIKKEFLKKLSHIKLNYRSKSKSNNFLSKIYIQRAITPKIELENNNQNWNDNYILLTRSHDEMRNISEAPLIAERFKQLQKKDYSKYFNHLEKSYYVTSVNDKDVWVISRKNDISYYVLNYKTHNQIKDKNNTSGIHRGFILDNNISYTNEIKPNIKLFINVLESLYHSYLNMPNNSFYKSSLIKLGNVFNLVTNSDGQETLNEEEFVLNPKVQFFFTLFAAKIHEKLGIDFSIYTKKSIENHSKKEEYEKFIIDLANWNLLGCAMFDEIMVTHVYQDNPKCNIKYEFDFNLQNGKIQSFKDFLSDPDFQKFVFFNSNANYTNILDDFINNDEFEKISDKFANLIKYESKHWLEKIISKKPKNG